MGFSFNPTLWFVCRLCKHLLASIEMLKEHKLACHLGECIGIKCSVFEERLLDKDWMPDSNSSGKENPISSIRLANRNALNRDGNKVLFDTSAGAKASSFKNPYVSLTRITDQKHSHNSWKKSPDGDAKLGQRSSCTNRKPKAADEESEISNHKLIRADRGETKSGYKIKDNGANNNHNSVSYDDIHPLQEIQPKKEFPIYEVQTPANSVGDGCAHFKLEVEDVKDGEFIVASVSSNPDGVSGAQFSSTLIPESGTEYEHLTEQNLTISKADSADSDLLDIHPAVQTQARETNNKQTRKRIQDQQSASFLNNRSKTGIGDKVVKSFKCETCFAFFLTGQNLKNHMLIHSSIKSFKCFQCPSAFKIKRNLTRHQIVHGRETK